jgi:hypothetical protein
MDGQLVVVVVLATTGPNHKRTVQNAFVRYLNNGSV